MRWLVGVEAERWICEELTEEVSLSISLHPSTDGNLDSLHTKRVTTKQRQTDGG